MERVYMSTSSVSLIGRFVLFLSVLYQRFHCTLIHTLIFIRYPYLCEDMFFSMCASSNTTQSRDSFLTIFLSPIQATYLRSTETEYHLPGLGVKTRARS